MSIKVKIHTNWCDDNTIMNRLNNSTVHGDYKWKDIELTLGDNYDFFVIFNYPRHANFDSKKTIIFQAETPNTRASWGQFSNPNPNDFFKVYDTKTYHNVDVWFHGLNYSQLLQKDTFKKEKTMSAIVTCNYSLPGHIARYNFLSALDNLDGFDHFGRGSFPHLKNHKGSLNRKEDGLKQYKYTFNCENDFENNYFTEKILDGIVCECLTFYDGCPNIEKFIDSRSFIKINVNNITESLEIVKSTISNNEYEKRLPFILKEKEKIMNELNPLEIIWKIIHGKI